jgi:hypothetical protein
MSAPWTIDDWNKIIAGVNGVVSGCNNGSNPSPLQPVTAPHIWTVKDVQAVRDALSGACSNASFSAPLTVWSQAIIDELNAMLGGNCQCKNQPQPSPTPSPSPPPDSAYWYIVACQCNGTETSFAMWGEWPSMCVPLCTEGCAGSFAYNKFTALGRYTADLIPGMLALFNDNVTDPCGTPLTPYHAVNAVTWEAWIKSPGTNNRFPAMANFYGSCACG